MKNTLLVGFIAVFLMVSGCQTENKIARQKFLAGKAQILVCPVHILENQNSYSDPMLSQRIVDFLNDKGYGVAVLSKLTPPANKEWRHNEAKMLTISINSFAEFVKKCNLPDETYMLYPEFLKAGPHATIVAVHYCVSNNKGEIAIRGLLNSHWEEFKKVNPVTDNDCVTVLINGLEVQRKR